MIYASAETLKKIKEQTNSIDLIKTYNRLDGLSNQSQKLRNSKRTLIEYKKLLESKNYSLLLNRKIKNEKDLVTTMCIAYSWMPTMLDIHGKRQRVSILAKKIAKMFNVEPESKEEREIIKELALITNHSLVGAIKTLHLVNPRRYPLVDSRVLFSWKKIFGAAIKNKQVISLGASWNIGNEGAKLEDLINKYFYYRAFLGYWSNALKKQVTTRDIEFRLYLVGDKIKQ